MAKNIENFLKIWIPTIVLIATMGVTWGYTKADVNNIRTDVIELQAELVPRTEMEEMMKRLDNGIDRLEQSVIRLEDREDSR